MNEKMINSLDQISDFFISEKELHKIRDFIETILNPQYICEDFIGADDRTQANHMFFLKDGFFINLYDQEKPLEPWLTERQIGIGHISEIGDYPLVDKRNTEISYRWDDDAKREILDWGKAVSIRGISKEDALHFLKFSPLHIGAYLVMPEPLKRDMDVLNHIAESQYKTVSQQSRGPIKSSTTAPSLKSSNVEYINGFLTLKENLNFDKHYSEEEMTHAMLQAIPENRKNQLLFEISSFLRQYKLNYYQEPTAAEFEEFSRIGKLLVHQHRDELASRLDRLERQRKTLEERFSSIKSERDATKSVTGRLLSIIGISNSQELEQQLIDLSKEIRSNRIQSNETYDGVKQCETVLNADITSENRSRWMEQVLQLRTVEEELKGTSLYDPMMKYLHNVHNKNCNEFHMNYQKCAGYCEELMEYLSRNPEATIHKDLNFMSI